MFFRLLSTLLYPCHSVVEPSMMLNANDLVAPGRSIQNVGSIGHEGERRIERILI